MDFRRSWLWNRRRPGQQSTILPSSQRSGAAAVAGILQPSDVVSFSGGKSSHLVQLGAGRDDLLDAELAQLGLELGELLRQIILALVPELDGLNLARRLITTFRVSESVSFLHCVPLPSRRKQRTSTA